eukprot:m.17320 g.17320  ORF g.17320 m.17320 type:complete len:358 (+) comp3487_c0_seq1:263-1336(+)
MGDTPDGWGPGRQLGQRDDPDDAEDNPPADESAPLPPFSSVPRSMPTHPQPPPTYPSAPPRRHAPDPRDAMNDATDCHAVHTDRDGGHAATTTTWTTDGTAPPEPSAPPAPARTPIHSDGAFAFATRPNPSAGDAGTAAEAAGMTDRQRYEAARAADADVECPVCMETIPPSHMAMRCAGEGGRPHYFHAACLREWARTCNANTQSVRCPVCRGAIQVHADRLQTMLQDPQVQSGLNAADRSFLEDMAERMRELGKVGWADLEAVITSENVVAAIGIAGAFGHGFWVANRRTWNPLSDELLHRTFESMTPQARVAHVVGLAVGFTFRVASELAQRENRDAEEERRRRERNDCGGRNR